MKIAVFTDTYEPEINGVVTSIKTFVEEFKREGHDVLVLAPKSGKDAVQSDDVWRFLSVPYPFQKEYRVSAPLPRNILKFIKAHKKDPFDIIHVQTPFTIGQIGRYLGWQLDVPCLHTYHTFWAEYLHYFPLLPKKFSRSVEERILSKRFCNGCDHIVAPSQAMKNKLVEYGVRKPIDVISTGVPLRKQSSKTRVSAFKRKHGVKRTDKVLAFVGRIGKEKNVYFLMHCFSRIQAMEPNAKLMIIGDGPERAELESLCRQLDLSERVVFTGYIPNEEVTVAYHCSTLISFPSKTETQGVSLLEGLATGKPAVCIDAMGVRDILKNDKGGLLTKDSVRTYSDAVISLLHDSKLYARKSEEALKKAEEYSSQRMAKKMLNLYASMID